jgi:hypothetical protein
MAFSWGGFARTLNENITKDRDAEREEQSYERRLRMQKELEKLYADEVVSRTVLEGDTEVMYNSRGRRIGERILSPEELAEAEAERKKVAAEARNAEATAGFNEFRLQTAPEDRALDRTLTQEQIASQRHSRAMDSARISIAERELGLRSAANGGLPKEVAEELNEVITMIQRLPINGINSPQAQTEALIASVKAAPDAAEAARIIAIVKGQIADDFDRAKTQATSRSGGFLSGLDDPASLPPPTGNR